MLRELWAALVLFGAMVLMTGILYPVAVTELAELLFPVKAAGSLVFESGVPVGSRLVGQRFSEERYFWGRPSATVPVPYNAAGSAGSNLGPANPAQADSVRQRVQRLLGADSMLVDPVPVDLVTASGSGLDPDISIEAALLQVPRVARARAISRDSLALLVWRHVSTREAGLLGEPRVNVMLLNLVLDSAGTQRAKAP